MGDTQSDFDYKLMHETMIGTRKKIIPITPQEIELIKKVFPEEVIESFNEIISKNYRKHDKISIVKQKDVIEEIKQKMKLDSEEIIFKNKWLDIEEIYEDNWIIQYFKPARDESFEAYFKFESKIK